MAIKDCQHFPSEPICRISIDEQSGYFQFLISDTFFCILGLFLTLPKKVGKLNWWRCRKWTARLVLHLKISGATISQSASRTTKNFSHLVIQPITQPKLTVFSSSKVDLIYKDYLKRKKNNYSILTVCVVFSRTRLCDPRGFSGRVQYRAAPSMPLRFPGSPWWCSRLFDIDRSFLWQIFSSRHQLVGSVSVAPFQHWRQHRVCWFQGRLSIRARLR